MIELREINWDNFWAVVNLKPKDTQMEFLPSNAVFMAQAYVNLKSNYPDACFAIYSDEDVVGFTKIVFVPEHEGLYHFSEDTYFIDAVMIDEKYQGRGYGRVAMEQILKFIRTEPWGKVISIKLSCYNHNTVATKMYESLGFVKTELFVLGKDGLRLYTMD